MICRHGRLVSICYSARTRCRESPLPAPYAAIRRLRHERHQITAVEYEVHGPELASHTGLGFVPSQLGLLGAEVEHHVEVAVLGHFIGPLDGVLDVTPVVSLVGTTAGDHDGLRAESRREGVDRGGVEGQRQAVLTGRCRQHRDRDHALRFEVDRVLEAPRVDVDRHRHDALDRESLLGVVVALVGVRVIRDRSAGSRC